MASTNIGVKSFLILLLLCSIFISATTITSTSTSPDNSHLSSISISIRSVCKSTPYPDVCFESLKLSVSININPNIITYIVQSLQNALSEAGKLSNLLSSVVKGSNIIEKQRGAIQDCKELHQITVSSIQKSISRIQSKKIEDARALLSAALTNKNTCLEGLESSSGPLKQVLVNSLITAYKYVSNSLSMLPSPKSGAASSKKDGRRHLMDMDMDMDMDMGVPKWLDRRRHRLLQSSGEEYDPSEVITVSTDGTGNFTTITDAINFSPNNSNDRIIIYVREGVYDENVEIPSYKTNIVLLGDGSDLTVITASRSLADGWTTFRSATLAVSGEGFLARDIRFENKAGAEKHQAVALRVNADLAAVYRCRIDGYQDTLYVHSFRQFYRECDISGTIDYIFGNAAAVFQACNIISRMPLPGQFTVITAQSRDTSDEYTGISIQNCSVLATDDLMSNSTNVNSYLGRPWRIYSRTVFIESYIDGFINPTGWTNWSGDEGFDTLYYGEYSNSGPGSGTENRVTWPGYHVMDYYDASNFTVSEFITGDEWLDSTSFPYDDGI